MNILTPRDVLNKGYRRVQIDHASYLHFVDSLEVLINNIHEEGQREEQQKNILTRFLHDSFYSSYDISAVDDIDLAIRLDGSSSSNIGVMFEIKGLGRPDMPTTDNINTKALRELILYYFRQRKSGNVDVRHLIITNTREFFIFDAKEFERLFFKDNNLRRQFDDFERGSLSDTSTDFFYSHIAEPAIARVADKIQFTYFSLKDYKNAIRNRDVSGKLTYLYRLLSPIHLLKLPFQNDSNSLNENFYRELLHLIGLEEVRDGSKTVIRRKDPNNREYASLLENAITIIEAESPRLSTNYGLTLDEKYFNAAMELCIVWINRVLFLKLLEAQLLNYHSSDNQYRFLNYEKITDFDGLSRLFFQVMAVDPIRRNEAVKTSFPNVPYLNSSLFELTELERTCLKISGLDQSGEISIMPRSVLTNDSRFKNRTKLPFLEYLFSFLDAYNFSSEGRGDVAEKPKTLINASVLGLIFEKINGYRDGAVFTPGFITNHICSSAIRRAVVNKFNEHYGWRLSDFDQLLDADYNPREANGLVNSLTICDPAVGSGHFLVSALNEIILIKSQLGCFFDTSGRRIKSTNYEISIENDELIITDDENELWTYRPNLPESRRIQEALFNEKRTIIENCLFGVDINPNSVNICRLRLWIELLKHAYYTPESGYTQLETLPNIDINIKCGNSLVQKFRLDDVIVNQNIRRYRDAVRKYKQTKTKEDKYELEQLIDNTKREIAGVIFYTSPVMAKFRQAEREYYDLARQTALFDDSRSAVVRRRDVKKLKEAKNKLAKATQTLEESKSNIHYKGGFEWRMEFPEILDDNGRFIGFDVIIGNPPYGVSIKGQQRLIVVNTFGKVPDFEIYYFFIQLAHNLLKNNGVLGYIIPNTYLFNTFAANYRLQLLDSWNLTEILDCTKFPVFKSAVVRNTLNLWEKRESAHEIGYRNTSEVYSFEDLISRPLLSISADNLRKFNQNWGLAFCLDNGVIRVIDNIDTAKYRVSTYYEVSQGYIPYRLSDLIREYGTSEGGSICKNRAWHSSTKIADDYLQEINGRDINKYTYHIRGEYVKYGRHLACYVDLRFFNSNRLVVREITNPKIIACKIPKDVVCVHDPQLIAVVERDGKISLNTLWAILNSRLATFYHFNHSPKATKGAFPKILVQDIKNFPIPEMTENIQERLKSMVEDILEKKKSEPQSDTSTQESEIDHIVYHLYGLTYDDVLIIDPDTPITRQEYESYV